MAQVTLDDSTYMFAAYYILHVPSEFIDTHLPALELFLPKIMLSATSIRDRCDLLNSCTIWFGIVCFIIQ